MAPQHQDVKTQATAADANATVVPVKNALNLEVTHSAFEHPELRQVFPDAKYPDIPILPFDDRAAYADPSFKNLLENATVTHLAPKIGTEISGLQLHELTNAQRDELALLIAQRGVVFFRNQQINMDQQLELGRYWGPLHIHQNLGHPEGYPEVVVVENSIETSSAFLKRQIYEPFNEWHSDTSNEQQVSTAASGIDDDLRLGAPADVCVIDHDSRRRTQSSSC
jgi:sulfonate dioxygenase